MTAVSDFTAAQYDVRLVQGDTLRETFLFKDGDGDPLDLFGYEFLSQVRKRADGPVLAEFDIEVTAAEGKVVRSLTPEQTSGLLGVFVHDLEWIEPDGRVRTLLSGGVEVRAEVSRDLG